MLVEFEKLPNTSKIWIYQSSRKFYSNEISELESYLTSFISTWMNGSVEIIGSYKIVYNRFIIIGVDDTLDTISTSMIDQSVAVIIGLQSKYDVELLDKLNICFKQGDHVQYKDIKTFKKLIKNKSVSKKTIVFNNLINTKGELECDWEIPLEESWQNRFL